MRAYTHREILNCSCLILLSAFSPACHRLKDKANDTIHSTGRTVGQGATEFVSGVGEGIDQTLECSLVLAPELSEKGLSYGKFNIHSDSGGIKNKLTVYLIFEKNFKQTLRVRLRDRNGAEYGRVKLQIEGKSGDAGYYDFVFDRRADIENKSSFDFSSAD